MIGHRVIITGDVAVGKTRLIGRLVDQAVQIDGTQNIVVLDLAPEVPNIFGHVAVPITQYSLNIGKTKYLHPIGLKPPRLQGRNMEDIISIAERNASNITSILLTLIEKPPKTLFIDDLTLYLHAGQPKILLDLVNRTYTFVATAYKGDLLADDKGSGITIRERQALEQLLNEPSNRIQEIHFDGKCKSINLN
jgi:hypothetical protein